MTSLMHISDNSLKVILFGKNASKKVIINFEIPALIFAFLGAYCLKLLTNLKPFYNYTLFDKIAEISYLKVIREFLLVAFA